MQIAVKYLLLELWLQFWPQAMIITIIADVTVPHTCYVDIEESIICTYKSSTI